MPFSRNAIFGNGLTETPNNFSFIVKAYQGMTGHHRGELPYASVDEMYNLFRLSITPLQEAGKLAMILVQFPPWFDCTKENVELNPTLYALNCMDLILLLNLDINLGILQII